MKLSIKKVFHCSVKKMRTKEKFHFLDIPAFLPLGPIIQVAISSIMAKLEMAKISICQCEKVLRFYMGKLLQFEIPRAEGYPNGKKIPISSVIQISHLLLCTFCHFMLSIDRRNGFR